MKLSRIIILALLVLAAGVLTTCKKKIIEPIHEDPPAAPMLLAILEFTQSTVDMSWSDQSTNEDGFRIEHKTDTTDWVTGGAVGAGTIFYQSTGLLAGTSYTFRVIAYNEAGDSAPSNERIVTTVSDVLPLSPTLVEALATSSTTIQVTWNDRGVCDSFQVNRRTDATAWARVARTADGVEEYIDNGLIEATTYFYRVGAMNQAGIAWSGDSAVATTPTVGAPASPSDLAAEIVVEFGVSLTWIDNATDEIGFIIARGLTGHQFQTIDSVGDNTTTYFDSLGVVTGTYNYRVRAYNEHGDSEWAPHVEVTYDFCSDGIIPLCLSPSRNYWHYTVDDSENDTIYEIERVVAAVEYLADYDHYLIIEHPYPQGETESDSLVYLRNFDHDGCRGVDYPLSIYSSSELLFEYPIGSLGSHYFYHGDSVLVISTGTTLTVGERTFNGVLGYQRFLRGTGRSIRYWVKPLEAGIVREEEVVSSQIVLTRDITVYGVNN